MRKFVLILVMAIVVLVGVFLSCNACLNTSISSDAATGAGVIGVFCIIFGTIWMFEA